MATIINCMHKDIVGPKLFFRRKEIYSVCDLKRDRATLYIVKRSTTGEGRVRVRGS